MTDLPEPPSRQQRQQQTRAALIEAAREVFAELGYHAANLERIARQAGFSKGAVYSNFSGKAALFLAVMDANLETVWSQPTGSADTPRPDTSSADVFETTDEAELDQVIRGFALATLEFIAVAARDEELSAELQQRMQDVVDQYTQVAHDSQIVDDELTPQQLGTLLTALDQGSGLLVLGGTGLVDDDLLGVGMQRLLATKSTTDEAGPVKTAQHADQPAEAGADRTTNSHIQDRLLRALGNPTVQD